jgi:glycine cleavage system aminomethyltransferase T
MTTTTANAVKVSQHLEFCQQVLWPDLDVQTVSQTEQWAQYAVAGPKARKVIEALLDAGQDISNEAFPYMACGTFTVCGGTPARLFRLSFSGELAYEIGVPARFGDGLIRAIMKAGAEHSIAPYGTEALGVMRIEKGHAAGPELNGQTTAHDLGLGKMMSTKKDFIGRFMGEREALNESARAAMVGLKPLDPKMRINAGAHLVPKDADAVAANDQGYVTSQAYSPELETFIGLAMLSDGPARYGEVVKVCDPLRNYETLAEVCSPHFVDHEGGRLRV